MELGCMATSAFRLIEIETFTELRSDQRIVRLQKLMAEKRNSKPMVFDERQRQVVESAIIEVLRIPKI